MGELGNGTQTSSLEPTQVSSLGNSVAQVALGSSHTCARKTDGTVWCWGYDLWGQVSASGPMGSPLQVTSLGTTVVEVAAGTDHSCVGRMDGSAWCWGRNNFGQLGDGNPRGSTGMPVRVGVQGASVLRLTAGYYHTCALKVDGTLFCWGANDNGQVGDGTFSPGRSIPTQVSLSCLETRDRPR
jgi:alpha-tubulin suppressor-like RCC1 family protein